MSESVFSKDVGIARRSAAELFGDDDVLQIVPNQQVEAPAESPVCVSSVGAPATTSKRERWRQAMREPAVVYEEVISKAKIIESPTTTVSDLKLKLPEEVEIDSRIFDDLSPLRIGAVGCRPDFIPSLASRQQLMPPVVTPMVAPVVVPVMTEVASAGADPVEHLVLVVHGINGSEDHLYRNLERMKESFEEVRSYWFGSTTNASLCHLELINWKSGVIGIQSSIFDKITPRGSLPAESRMFINYAISDVVFYLTPSHCDLIRGIVVDLINDRINQLIKAFPSKFNLNTHTKVTIVGYSLGSVIVHDILTSPVPDLLSFVPYKLFLWGSPLAGYLAVKDGQFMIGKFNLPKQVDLYNIYHPHDPVAFRIEPLFYHLDSELADAETVPFWKTDGIMGWGSSVRSIFASAAIGGSDSKQLVPKRRLDYVLQESVTESLSHHYSMLTAHYSYWSSRDVALFMLRRMTGLEPSRSR